MSRTIVGTCVIQFACDGDACDKLSRCVKNYEEKELYQEGWGSRELWSHTDVRCPSCVKTSSRHESGKHFRFQSPFEPGGALSGEQSQ